MKKGFVVLLGLFVFLFALQFVAAANPIGDWFANWESANISPNIAKYLFWALVSMVVFAIGSQIPGINKLFENNLIILGAAFSIIVGFLSMAYITPEEVYALMTSYTALGFVIGGALPFIILFFFTINLAMKSEEAGATQRYMSKMFAVGLWILFTIFIAVKAIYPVDEAAATGVYYTLTWALVGLSVLSTISVGWIFHKVQKDVIKEKQIKGEEVMDNAAHSTMILDQFGNKISRGSNK